jgi:hypothetical protein
LKYFLLLTFICSLGQFSALPQTPNYEIYHSYINKAEELFFIDNKADSSLYFYRKAFSEFDFAFVKDPLNAAQIAYFCNQPFEEYLIKGFENGLKVSHLSSIKLFNTIYDDLSNNKSLQDNYKISREKYIKKLDYNYLSYLYEKAINDQIDKKKDNYDAIKFKNLEDWLTRIRLKGFPSAKIIGIDDENIFRETGKPEKDIDQLKIKYSNTLNHLTTDDEILSSSFIMIILVHNQCSFQELKNIFGELVKKGEIHPREVGLLYDNQFRTSINKPNYRCQVPRPVDGLFYLNMFCQYNKLDCSKQQSDMIRKKWFVVSLTVDEAKKEYEQKYGFRLSYGFWNCM